MSVNHDYSNQLVNDDYNYRKLFEEHQRIEGLIHELEVIPAMNDAELKGLKKIKLSVVDQMTRIEQRHQIH